MAVRVATCKKCEVDVFLDDVVGVRDFEKSRRLTWLCSDCGHRDSFTYSFKDYRRMIKHGDEAVVGVVGVGFDSEYVGRMVQGFRVELDELDRDFGTILAGWDYEDRRSPWDVPRETNTYVGLGYSG